MAVKTITIKKKVYDRLANLKGESESFSDLFERLAAKETPDLMKFAGILSDKSADELERAVARNRKLFNESFKRRQKTISGASGK